MAEQVVVTRLSRHRRRGGRRVLGTDEYLACISKRRFDEEPRIWGRKKKRIRAYRCTYCDGWHLTKRLDAALGRPEAIDRGE